MYCFSSRLRYIAAFVLAYMAAGVSYAVINGNQEFTFYAVVMVVLIAVTLFMDKRVTFSPAVLWALAFWGLFHISGGILPIPEAITEPNKSQVLYNMRLFPWFPKYDQIIHVYGFGLTVFITYEALSAHVKARYGIETLQVNAAVIAILVLTSMGLGCVNEIIEFLATLSLPETNVGGYINTGWDMVSNTVGAILAVIYLRFRKLT